jgi:putative ABC transport system ATP-binding protein
MKEPIIKTKDLRVIYNQGKSNEVRSLEDANIEIYPQEYVIIFGPSGCGKSTLLYAISGLQAPTYGDVSIEGKKLSEMNKKEKVNLHRNNIGMVFQAFYLVPSLSILGNVCLPKSFSGISKKDRELDGMKLLQRFSIAEQANKFPSELSGGQKQRVSIARSLINNPQIILADEPVGNLDSESAENVLRILKELNEIDKKTIILVTHNPEHLHFADRIIHMKDGKVMREEVNREKRPIEVVERKQEEPDYQIPAGMRILMRTFKNLNPQQLGVLLIPFKAKQLLDHVLSDLTEAQLNSAENYIKELLFRNIDINAFERGLDLDYEKGGANWNKQRARSFSSRVRSILGATETLSGSDSIINQYSFLSEYLVKTFSLNLDEKLYLRLQSLIKLRLENKIDGFGLAKKMDLPVKLGGLGLYKSTADKVVREVEVIILLRYTKE